MGNRGRVEGLFQFRILPSSILENGEILCMLENIIQSRLLVGEVLRTGAADIDIVLYGHRGDSRSNHPVVRIGDYVLVEEMDIALFCQVVSLELRGAMQKSSIPDMLSVARIQILSSVDLNSEQVFLGVVNYPQLGASVYLAPPGVVARAVVLQSPNEGKEDGVVFHCARLADPPYTPLSLQPEALFGRHCAVLGTSGGGKSWTTARLVEECAAVYSKVILIDATGEYGQCVEGSLHTHIGKTKVELPGSLEVCLPYYELLESDLFAILAPSGDVQAPKLRAAIRTLKIVELEPHLGLNGVMHKANRSKVQFNEACAKHFRVLESPNISFDIAHLGEQLKLECVNEMRSATETDIWGNYNSHEESMVFPLITKVNDLLSSSMLEPIFLPGDTHSLYQIVDWFLQRPDHRIMVFSIGSLSFQYRAREIVANALGRRLLQHARDGMFLSKPVLLLADEAHQFLKEETTGGHLEYRLDSFAMIAKEARKYSLNICIATQRPRDIPESVLSQMGTMIVHRLTNDCDRQIVERACGEMDRRAMDALPVLAPGESVLMGIDIPIPLKIKFNPPRIPPRSSGPNFQKFWKS